MDWRAKSQSRSRSRAPDAMMDWRAQSRSRSRAPAFRVPLPLAPVSTYDNASAQHLGSRFFGDTGGYATPADEKARLDLVSSLGMGSGNGDYSAGVSDFDQFTRATTNGAGPSSAVEDSLNHLINLQPLAPSPLPTTAAPSPWIHERNTLASPSTSPAKAALASSANRKEEKRSVGVVVEEEEDEYAFLTGAQQQSARSNGASAQVQQLSKSVGGICFIHEC